MKFKEAFKYPSIEKDMAFIMDRNIVAGDIIKDIKKCGNKTLQSVEVFDVYEGENIDKDKKSIAFNLVFNGIDRTLKDEEVMQEFNKIIKKIEEKYNAILRDK